MNQLFSHFKELLILYQEGNLTDEDFFEWLLTTIEKDSDVKFPREA